ncbi:MAG: hypothetical protein LBR47_07125 [Spirochaetaceae bacterium]|nr:hypothetical protein [Spirochaetaceae bacterium]
MNIFKTPAGIFSVTSPTEMLKDQIAGFETALATFNNPNHGKVDMANKNGAKKALVSALRTYVQGFIVRNPKVSYMPSPGGCDSRRKRNPHKQNNIWHCYDCRKE